MAESDVIGEIKARVGIADVVGERVRLARTGRNLKGLCPFHNEKTPSFVVYPQNGSYHCFGCGENGDAFGFLMKTEGLDFRGALEKLAGRAGVEIKPRTEEADAHDRVRDRLKEACAAAAAFYHNLFRNHPAAALARQYAEKRGLLTETIEMFQIGFAPDSWDILGDYLKGRGYTAQELVDAGLVAERDEGGHYDRFRNRLLFPIRDAKGATVGFGGRALGEGQVPKYLNSPQTTVFDKGSILYGFDLARPHIQRAGRVVLVEGYMDVVVAHQAGQRDVVGTSGTALTDRHADLLKRIAKRIILCLDPDSAGDTAAIKGSEVLQEHADHITIPIRGERGLMAVERRTQTEIRVMSLPRGFDPDELLLREGGPKQWEELRDAALPLVEHVIGVIAAKHDISTARGKSEAVGEVAGYVREVGDPVQRAHYAQRVASVLRVPEDAVMEALRSADSGRKGRNQRQPDNDTSRTAPRAPLLGLPAPIDPHVASEEHLLGLALQYPQVTWMVHAPLPEDFTRQENRLVYAALAEAAAEADKVNVDGEGIRKTAAESLDPTLAAHIERILSREEPELFRFALPYEVEGRLKRLRQHNDRIWLEQCRLMIQEAQESGDAEAIQKLLPLLGRSFSRFRHYNPKPSTVFRDSRD